MSTILGCVDVVTSFSPATKSNLPVFFPRRNCGSTSVGNARKVPGGRAERSFYCAIVVALSSPPCSPSALTHDKISTITGCDFSTTPSSEILMRSSP